MSEKALDLLSQILIAINSKPDSVIIAAKITICGMLASALLTAVLQYLITRSIIKSDFNKIKAQLQMEYELNRKQEWINQLRKIIGELLTETDPEGNVIGFDKKKITSLIHQAQLMLTIKNENENKLNTLLNALGLVTEKGTLRAHFPTILSIQATIIEASKKIFNY